MTTGIIIGIVVVAIAGCLYTHRRVIRALINHEPMPKAPSWHIWIKKENRRAE